MDSASRFFIYPFHIYLGFFKRDFSTFHAEWWWHQSDAYEYNTCQLISKTMESKKHT